MARPDPDGSPLLARLSAGAPRRTPNVRTLAQFAANAGCNLASLGFAAGVDFDQLLAGTSLAAPFGQSSFAFRRGNRFEELLRADGHAPLLGALGDALGADVVGARVASLRAKGPSSRAALAARAERTASLVSSIVGGAPAAPNLLDGAVLTRTIGGVTAFFEADAVAARFGGELLRVGEIKSFPTVDGHADPTKAGAAFAQAAIYALLLQDLVEQLGGRRTLVSTEALLITPRNTGLQPVAMTKDLALHIERARRILARAADPAELAGRAAEAGVSFGRVAGGTDESDRLEALHAVAESTGTTYRPDCLSSCGLGRFCRERAHQSGAPVCLGSDVRRLLPGIATVERAASLARGAPPTPTEAPVATQLVRAGRLVERARARMKEVA